MLSCLKLRIGALAAVVVAVIVLLPGCGGALGMSSMLRVVGVTALVPKEWSSKGGWVEIVADVVSGESLKKVVAKVIRRNTPTPLEVILTRNAEGKYEGTFEATENPNDATPVVYTTVVEAVDASGNTATSDAVSVEVPPAE